MKQFISLLLIISITVISWSSYAKSTVIRVDYSQPSPAISSMVLKPSQYTQHTSENFSFVSTKATNKHHNFFELAIIFNEKLQQFIAFFTHFGDEVEEITSNNMSTSDISSANALLSNTLLSYKSQSVIQKCKASS